MAAIGWRAGADIDRDIEDTAFDDAHQLRLGKRGRLIMQSANSAGSDRVGGIILHEAQLDAVPRKYLRMISFAEPAACVIEPGRLDEKDAGRLEWHEAPLARVRKAWLALRGGARGHAHKTLQFCPRSS